MIFGDEILLSCVRLEKQYYIFIEKKNHYNERTPEDQG